MVRVIEMLKTVTAKFGVERGVHVMEVSSIEIELCAVSNAQIALSPNASNLMEM